MYLDFPSFTFNPIASAAVSKAIMMSLYLSMISQFYVYIISKFN
jgi:hypothetical protein